ncbi:CFIA complex component Rna14, putative [Talaromyces stipitatus ATCC 10500]|uniref:mRNA 3'-end-processing protein RNA14 n=1 Tax=Talaromyces stipitatus (strain ATCC 10500 / CBS 375.48 / QM 6759 / NRRL 1006) TaxID=441959 RepID=B8M5L3_TALSN|nr:CFIA complex component Rna14, putative [Talaromyces stipitatus ATCC 10500]EED19907.1 CFIA complex component Rna14, putative [Talaromyces stipitatus ATCC 10500]
MAEEDAEQAFFQTQAMSNEYDPAGVAQDVQGTESEDDYDPSNTLHDEYSVTVAEPNPNGAESNDASSATQSIPHDSYQPEEVDTTQTSQAPSRRDSQTSVLAPSSTVHVQPKTKTIGGFVVDDDDEDEEQNEGEDEDKDEAEYEPPGVLETIEHGGHISAGASEQLPYSDKNANETISTSGVSIQPLVPDMATSKDVSNNPVSSYSAHNLYIEAMYGGITDSNAPTPIPLAADSAASRNRLPHDRIGLLEDRIKEDPRGDIRAWIELIAEHRSRNRLDNAREVYERFLKVFPSSAEQWVAYIKMESENNELQRLEQIFNRTLLNIPNVQLWTVYLDYIRRRHPLTTDTSGQARRTITSAYDLALTHVGLDRDAASLWLDYVEFIKTGPGVVGGTNWQDQQKMDLLRKAYQRAICVPTHSLNTLWKEYDQFEMGLNKLTGRKFLQERSPAYMTARSSYTELQNLTRDLDRTTLPQMPPAPGFAGEAEFQYQVGLWRRWINWEKGDPLVLKEEDISAYRNRVLYAYKQALMALRFVPDIWFEAADFCFQNGMDSEGNDFLNQGIEANPESCLLAFKRADRLEIESEPEQDLQKRGAKVREVFDKLLDALYALNSKAREREEQDIARIKEQFANESDDYHPVADDEDEAERSQEAQAKEAAKKSQIDAMRKAHATQITMTSKLISFAWIALMRAMRRIQGKGKPGELAGSRQVFAEARKRGRITSDVYIASALIEYHCYKDPAATRIFERGARLFPDDENFALEYLKHLFDINDVTNARAVFEMTIRRLASKPENVVKTKPIFTFLHDYESRYGDLGQVINLENRMRELFPDDPTLSQFAHRHTSANFDPIAAQPVISLSQVRPRSMTSLDQQQQQQTSLQGTPTRYLDVPPTGSPKRPFPLDDFEDENRPRKFARAESPLKGIPARRPDQLKRPTTGQVNGGGQYRPQPSAAPLPRDVVHLLSIIPPASAYNAGRFSAEKLVDLIRKIDIPSSTSQLRHPAGMGY